MSQPAENKEASESKAPNNEIRVGNRTKPKDLIAQCEKLLKEDKVKEIVERVSDNYPEWHKNEGIKELQPFYRIYLKALHHKQYKLIVFLLKLLHDKINVS